MIKAIFFDLDGTLLPMDPKVFVPAYLELVANKAMSLGYDKEKFINTIIESTKAMIANNGDSTNEALFWKVFLNAYGDKIVNDKEEFDDLYKNHLHSLRATCGYNERAKELILLAKEKGYRVILATNPVFPSVVTETRVNWAGLDKSDFEIVTTYENFHYSKPNVEYYKEILNMVGLSPSEVLMVGNDVDEDMVSETIGISTFLLTDCLLNRSNKDISKYTKGNFNDLVEYIKSL